MKEEEGAVFVIVKRREGSCPALLLRQRVVIITRQNKPFKAFDARH